MANTKKKLSAPTLSLKGVAEVVKEVITKELIPVRKAMEEKIEYVKKDLLENFGSMRSTLAQHTKQHSRLETEVAQLQGAIRATKDELLSTKDELLTEIKGIREELKSHIKPRLEDHEVRLSALETT